MPPRMVYIYIYSSPLVSTGDTFQDLPLLAVNVLIFSDCGKPRITETIDTESTDTGVLLYREMFFK
jgi:hypothetical protein